MKQIFSTNFYMLKLIAASRPSHILLTIFISFLKSVHSILNILIVKVIVDSLGGTPHLTLTMTSIIFAAIFELTVISIQLVCENYLFPINQRIIQQQLRTELIRKAISVEFQMYEDSTFFDKYNMAIAQSDARAIAVLNTFAQLANSLFSILALIGLLAYLSPILVIVSISGAVLSTFFSIYSMKMRHNQAVEMIPSSRKNQYIQRITYLREFIQEICSYPSMMKLIEEKYTRTTEESISIIKSFAGKLVKNSVLVSLCSIAVSTTSMLYAAVQVVKEKISIGSFTALFSSCTQLFQQFKSLIMVFFQMYEHSLYIENYLDFMGTDTPKLTGNIKLNSHGTEILIEHLTFKYKNTTNFALNDISLKVNRGEKIVILGENGSGKSTLLKLILRLYIPNSGKITINGYDISKLDYEDYLSDVGAVLQDYSVFAFSIAENILMRPITDANRESSEQQIWDALKFVGLEKKVQSLTKGIYTVISKEFDSDGCMFSGGELQRLMIARAYAKQPSLLIFDEAFSALDQNIESEILSRLFALGSEKTVIFVTHQIKPVLYADRVIVMKDGKITKDGPSAQTLKTDCQSTNWTHPDDNIATEAVPMIF